MSDDAPRRLRIGTRGSALALVQSALVAEALAANGHEHDIVTISTAGDRRSPDTPWGEGAFVGAIEEALLDGRIDVGVHSAKDVPTDEDHRLTIGAYLPRADPRDALVPREGLVGTLDELPHGAVVGTDSPRRRGFLLAQRPDLDVRALHGNVDTRLRRLDAGEADALVLAVAGLERLGHRARIGHVLPARTVPPAPGQGALAVQARADDPYVLATITGIDDTSTRVAVEAERALLDATGGGCRAPVGALAEVAGERVSITAGFATLDGRTSAVETVTGALGDATTLARELAARLVEHRATIPGAPRVLVTRPRQESLRVAARLSELGVAPVIVATIAIDLIEPSPGLDAALRSLPEFEWAIVTSANGVRAVARAAAADRWHVRLGAVRWAAVGRATARALAAAGVADIWMPAHSDAAAIAEELPVESGDRVVWFRGSLADDGLAERLRERGAIVTPVTVYRTLEAPDASRAALADALARGPLDAVIFASPSAVRGLLAIAGRGDAVDQLPAICVGPRTAQAARDAGFAVVAEVATQDASVLAELAAAYVTGVTE